MAVSCPHTFSFGSHDSYPWWQEVRIPSKLSTMHLVKCGSKKNKGGGGITQISQKKKLFQSFKKTKCNLG